MSMTCGWCDGDGAADWVYDLDGGATALEAYLPDELAVALDNGGKIVRGEECEECNGTGNRPVVDMIMDYEAGNLDTEGVLYLFAQLIGEGTCWTLQGSYGRMAKSLIDMGLIDTAGNIDWDAVDERIEHAN